MKNLILSLIYLLVGYTMVWFQLFGSIKYEWLKNNNWWFMYVTSLPIAYFMTTGTHLAFSEFKNSAWSVRFATYVINIFVFTILSYVVNNEDITPKTMVCLVLTFIIILIQLYWK